MARRSGLFRFALLLGAATVLGVTYWGATGGFLATENVREGVERAAARSTHRDLRLEGRLKLIVGLSPGFVAEDVRLANPPGASRPDVLTAKSLRARIDLLPLLEGRVVVREVVLDGADLLLERLPDGTPNWTEDDAAAPAQPKTAKPARAPRAAPANGRPARTDFAVHRLALTNSRIAWRQAPAAEAPAAVASVDVDDLEFSAEALDAPMKVSLKGRAGGLPLSAEISAGNLERLLGGPVAALAGAWPLGIKASAGDATLRLDGGVTHPDTWRGYNFVLTANAPDLAPLAPYLPAPLALPLHEVNATVRLSDGPNEKFRTSSLSLHAGQSDLSAIVPGLLVREAVFSAPGPGQQAQLSVDGTFRNTKLRLVATATQPDVLTPNVPVPVALSAEAASASFSARGTVPPTPGGAGLDLAVGLRAPDLADLAPFALRPLPSVKDVTLDARVQDAGFRLRGVAVHDLAFASALGDLAGDVTLAVAPVLSLSGNLTSKRLDVDGLRAAIAALPASDAAPATPAPQGAPAVAPAIAPAGEPPAPSAAPDAGPARLIPDAPLPFPALRGADGDLSLTLGTLLLGGQEWREGSAHLVAQAGKVVLNPLRVRAPSGVLIGAVSLDAGATPPAAAVTLRSPSLNAAGVAALLGAPGAATGSVQIDAALSGTGETTRALAATLDGHFGLAMVDGTVTEGALFGLLGDTLQAAGVSAGGGSRTVRCLALRTDFHNGTGRLAALSLFTDRFALDGDGTIDLAAETLGLHLRPTVTLGNLAAGGIAGSAPISLTGPLSAPRAALDPAIGGRVGFTLGGAGPDVGSCAAQLSVARGGMPGPLPAAAPAVPAGQRKKPKNLLQDLLPH